MDEAARVCPRCHKPAAQGISRCPDCGANLPPALPEGTVLQKEGASYAVGAVLGQGGFGITYKGVDKKTGRPVAIKEFFPARETQWAGRDSDGVSVVPCAGREDQFTKGRMSFLKEARVVAKLDDSPASVVKGIDYLETNGTAYLVLEFLPGRPLFKEVRARPGGTLTPKELFPKLLPLMDGISWIHSKNIIHRDICPDNIMWKPDGSLTLTDFGSARQIGGQMTELFKPRYAPVEQETTTAGPAGRYSDVYTLAMTVLYCLTGKNPAQSTERVSQVFGSGQPDPLFLPDCLTAEQKAVFQKAAAIRPADRYQTMGEFKRALIAATPWLKDTPTPPPPPPPKPTFIETLAEFIKTHFMVVVIAGVLVLALILLLVIIGTRDVRTAAPELPPALLAAGEAEDVRAETKNRADGLFYGPAHLMLPSESFTMNRGRPWTQ